MAEQITQLDVLNDIERAAIEHPGLEQRARTLLAVAELATMLGVDTDIREVLLDRVRTMDAQQAKSLRKSARQLSEVIGRLELDLQPEVHAAAESIPMQEAPSSPAVEEGAHDTLDTIAPDSEAYKFDFEAVRSFYKTINKKTSSEWLSLPSSPTDIDTDEILALIALHSQNNPKQFYATKTTEKLIALLKSDAPKGQSTDSFKFDKTNRIAELLNNLQTMKVEGTVQEVIEPVPGADKSSERKELDDEPPYVEIALRYENLLDFDSAEATAFKCLINPDNRGELTDNKRRAIAKVRERIETELGSLHGIRGKLAPAEAVRIANLLGFFIREKNTGEQQPTELSQQLRRVDTVEERRALTINLYRGLNTLADVFEENASTAVSGEVVPLPVQRPLQVRIDVNGKPRLA